VIELGANRYGKAAIRVVRVLRGGDGDRVLDLTVAIALEGDFESAHTDGDNSLVIATDTMKNTAYALAAEHPNILWLTCEDISPNLGCYGDHYSVTPNLDRLAAKGMRYTNANSNAPVCAAASHLQFVLCVWLQTADQQVSGLDVGNRCFGIRNKTLACRKQRNRSTFDESANQI